MTYSPDVLGPAHLGRVRGLDEPHDQRAARHAWEHDTGWHVGTIAPPLPRGFRRHSSPWNWQTLDDSQPVHAFDHTYRITRPGRPASILTMPYGLHQDDAVDLSTWCRERGGNWHVLGAGWSKRPIHGSRLRDVCGPCRLLGP